MDDKQIINIGRSSLLKPFIYYLSHIFVLTGQMFPTCSTASGVQEKSPPRLMIFETLLAWGLRLLDQPKTESLVNLGLWALFAHQHPQSPPTLESVNSGCFFIQNQCLLVSLAWGWPISLVAGFKDLFLEVSLHCHYILCVLSYYFLWYSVDIENFVVDIFIEVQKLSRAATKWAWYAVHNY